MKQVVFLQLSTFINLPCPSATSYITPRASLPHSPLHILSLSFPSLPLPLLTSFFLFSTCPHYCLTAFFNIPDHTPHFFAIFLFASTFFWSPLCVPLSHPPPHQRDTGDCCWQVSDVGCHGKQPAPALMKSKKKST